MALSPTLGRFLQMDPAEYIDGPNEYQNELSNPVNQLDSTGLDATSKPTIQPKGLTPEQRAQLRDLISGYEGNYTDEYPDSKLIPTIGIGHNLRADNGTCERVTGTPAKDLVDGGSLTQANVDKLFDADLDQTVDRLRKRFPNFDSLPPDVQTTLIDLSFNLGDGGLAKFHDFCDDINKNDFSQAAYDLGHKTKEAGSPPSKYVGDVGQRAIDNINRLEGAGKAQAQH